MIMSQSRLPGRSEFSVEEEELATQMSEWAEVEKWRGRWRAMLDVDEFILKKISKPTKPEYKFNPRAFEAAYLERIREMLRYVGDMVDDAVGGDVHLITDARLAARRRIEDDRRGG
jgi:hypothetical protein